MNLHLAIFTASSLLLAAPAAAITIIDNFNDGNNVGWTDASPLAGFGAASSYSYPGGNSYRLTVGASPNPGALGASRGASLRNDGSYTQFSSSVDVLDWNLAGGNDMVVGMLGRVSDVGLGTTDGYGFFYAASGAITLARIANEAPATLTFAPVSLTSGIGYRFVFTADGSNLAGQVFALSNLAVPLASVNTVDATFASGVNGLFVYDAHSPASAANHTPSATFDNYYSAIPEPSASLLGLPVLGMGMLRRRR